MRSAETERSTLRSSALGASGSDTTDWIGSAAFTARAELEGRETPPDALCIEGSERGAAALRAPRPNPNPSRPPKTAPMTNPTHNNFSRAHLDAAGKRATTPLENGARPASFCAPSGHRK